MHLPEGLVVSAALQPPEMHEPPQAPACHRRGEPGSGGKAVAAAVAVGGWHRGDSPGAALR